MTDNPSIIHSLVWLLLLITLTSSCQISESPQSAKAAVPTSSSDSLGLKIDDFILKKMADENLPGLAIAVVKDGMVLYKNGYGLANIETGQTVNPDSTIFRIGSVSKALTLLSLTKLIDQGKIGYEDDVTSYLDYVQNPLQLKDTLKVKHILTHTGGLEQFGKGRQVFDFDLSLEDRKAKRESLTEFAKDNTRRIRPAGQHFTYDTYGATLGGALIAKLTGLSYTKAMEELMFKPLGMTLTSVEVETRNEHLLAKGHGYNNGNYNVMPYEVYKTLPASSIDATVADMGRLLQALTSDGTSENGTLYSDQMTSQVMASQFKPHPEFVGMSHGLWEANVFGSRPRAFNIRTLGHGGTMLGTTSQLIIAPALNLGVFVVASRDTEAGGGGVSIWEVFNVIFGHFEVEKAPLYEVPAESGNLDLSEYAGHYYHGLYCHTCTEEDFNKGAWQRGSDIEIQAQASILIKDGTKYIPRGDDVFVREDGMEMIFFGRNDNDQIVFFVSSEDSTSFERID